MADSFEGQGIAVKISFKGVSALGKLQGSVSADESAGWEAQALDEVGSTEDEDRGDLQATFDAEYIPYDGKTFPKVGSIVDVSGFTESRYNGAYRVTGGGETQNQTDYPRKPLSFIRYLDNGVPASTTTTTTTT